MMPNLLSYQNTLGAGRKDRLANEGAMASNALSGAQTRRMNALAEREQQQFDEATRLQNTQWLLGAAEEARQNPAALPTFISEAKRRGIMDPSFAGEIGDNELSIIANSARTALGGNAQNVGPAGYQEFSRLATDADLDQNQRAQAARIRLGLESRGGQARVTDVGGVPTYVGMGEGGQPFAIPVSDLPAEMQAAYSLSNAERAGTEAAITEAVPARGQAERLLELPEARSRLAATEEKMDRLAESAQSILDDDGLWQAVGLGRGLASIPASAGARVRAKIDNLQAQAGLAVLQDMRDNSKTGGAVGQVSDFEQRLFQNNLAPLANMNVSPEDYRRAVEGVRDYATSTKGRFREAFIYTYPELEELLQTQQVQTQQGQSEVAPEGTIISDAQGQRLIKRNGQWEPL